MDNITQLSMVITKASRRKSDGLMKLRMVNSATGEDSFGEKMSLGLFTDFIRRSDGEMKVPAPFDEIINEDGYWEVVLLICQSHTSVREQARMFLAFRRAFIWMEIN